MIWMSLYVLRMLHSLVEGDACNEDMDVFIPKNPIHSLAR